LLFAGVRIAFEGVTYDAVAKLAGWRTVVRTSTGDSSVAGAASNRPGCNRAPELRLANSFGQRAGPLTPTLFEQSSWQRK